MSVSNLDHRRWLAC